MTDKMQTTAATESFEKRGGYITPANIVKWPAAPAGPGQGSPAPSAPTGSGSPSGGSGTTPAPSGD